MTEEDKKDEWDIVIVRCPICSSTKRFVETIGEELIEEDKASIGTQTFSKVVQSAFVDIRKPMIIGQLLPGFRACFDICMDCGTEYVVRMYRIKVDPRSIATQTAPLPSKHPFGKAPQPPRTH